MFQSSASCDVQPSRHESPVMTSSRNQLSEERGGAISRSFQHSDHGMVEPSTLQLVPSFHDLLGGSTALTMLPGLPPASFQKQ